MRKKKTLDFGDCVRVVANVHDLDTNRYSVELKFQDIYGKWSKAVLARKIIRSGTSALDEMLERGANIPTEPGAGAKLRELLNIVPERTYRITSKTGWHDKSFVLPDVTIGPDSDTLVHASRKFPNQPEPTTQGNLNRWLEGLREPCSASSYLTFAIGLAFAGPLRHLVGQDEGAIFYLTGQSTTGKTLTELCGLSAIERAVRNSLLTHDATDRRIEEDCAAHNDLLQVIDEISRENSSQAECRAKVRRLAHKIAGGGGSRRSAKARQDADLADLQWRLSCLWSGEHSLGVEFLGYVRTRGELVRLIEIPVPEPKDGIFDRLGSVQLSRTKLVLRAEEVVKENFGHAIRALIKQLVAGREAHTQRATQLIEGFLEKVGASGDPWTRRFAGKFAIVYAAAKIAAELKLAPWSSDHPFKCVKRLYKRARELVATPEEALQDLLHKLTKNASSNNRFPEFKKGKKLARLKKAAWGVRNKARDGTPFLAVESSRLERLVRPAHHAGAVRKLLVAGGYIVPGKEGRHVRQIKVQGFGSAEKPYFMCVRLGPIARA
jgi:Domain of unknown function (DUF927)